jgi:hypothetical protein
MFNTLNLIRSAVTGVTIASTYFIFNLVSSTISTYLYRRAEHRFMRKLLGPSSTPAAAPVELPIVQGDVSPLSPADISDTAVASDTNVGGIVFAENTAVTSSQTGPQSVLSDSVDDRADALRLLKIPVRVAAGTWTTSATADTQLWTMNYNNAHLSNDRWAPIFARYVFYRYRLKVRVEVNGTSFHQGKLILYYSPGLPAGTQYTELSNVTSLDHRSLYASYNNVQELVMPWQYHFDFARVNPNSTFVSFIALSVFNALETGTGGSTSVNYTVWLSMEDVELKVPAPVTVPATMLTVLEQTDELPVVQGFLDFSTTNISQQFSNIADSALPTNITGDKFDTNAHVSGLDNPSEGLNANPVKVRAVDSLSNTTGVVNNFRMALNPSKMIDPGPEYFDVADDEMSLKYLTSRWSLVSPAARNIGFSASSVVGTPLFSAPVNPGLIGGSLNNATNPTAAYRSLLQYMAQRFSRWRGSVKFAVEIIATQYQTGKLFLGFQPYYTAPAASTIGNPDLLTNYGMVVEINKGKNIFEVTIPFYSMNEWASVLTFNGNTSQIESDILGYFYITAINPLATLAAAPNTVRLNVYVAGGDDFEFAFPFGNASGAVLPQGDGTIGQYKRTRGTNTYSDVPSSVRDLIRRPWYWFGTNLAQIVNSPVRFALIPLDSLFAEQASGSTTPSYNRLGGNINHWGALFRGFIGDLRLKIMLTRKSNFGDSPDSIHQAFNNYPVWCTHIPTLTTAGASYPGDANVLASVRLWLAQRYSTACNNTIGYASMNSVTNAAGFECGTIYDNMSMPAIGAFEEVIIDPIKSVELEIPYNGIARFATRGDTDNFVNIEKDHKGGYGYLLLHTWCNDASNDNNKQLDFLWADIHASVGDNFRFGMHTGIPYAIAGNSSTANPIGRYNT